MRDPGPMRQMFGGFFCGFLGLSSFSVNGFGTSLQAQDRVPFDKLANDETFEPFDRPDE